MTRDQLLEEFIQRAGFHFGWQNLESWARCMAEQAVTEMNECGDNEIMKITLTLDSTGATHMHSMSNSMYVKPGMDTIFAMATISDAMGALNEIRNKTMTTSLRDDGDVAI